MPMNKTFTPIIWNYQSYSNHQLNEVYNLNTLLEPLEVFQNLLIEIDERAPNVSDAVVRNILERI